MKVVYFRDILWFIDKDARILVMNQGTKSIIVIGTMFEVITSNMYLTSFDWIVCNIRACEDEKGTFLEIVLWRT